MSPLAKVNHSRNQWKGKAIQRGDLNRYLCKELARVKAKTSSERATCCLRQLERQVQAVAVRPKVEIVRLTL